VSKRFRKKPVVINAHRYETGEEGWKALMRWLESLGLEGEDSDGSDGSPGMWLADDYPSLIIDTLEGEMRADKGDWIIQGVKGEFYPCKPDIFDATYEPADQPTEPAVDLEGLRERVRELEDEREIASEEGCDECEARRESAAAEAERYRDALSRLQMGPDTLTQAGLKIVLDAQHPQLSDSKEKAA
jgi:hypothetical protein